MRFSRQERQEHADLATRLAAIESKLTNQTVKYCYFSTLHFFTPCTNSSYYKKLHLKQKFPRFDGSNPLGWNFKINPFFNFHNRQEEQHISNTSFHVDAPALNQYQWMYNNNQLTYKLFTCSQNSLCPRRRENVLTTTLFLANSFFRNQFFFFLFWSCHQLSDFYGATDHQG